MQSNSNNNPTKNYREAYPLHEAVRKGLVDVVQGLLERNVDVNQTDGSGNTPLLLAVCVKNEDTYTSMVRLLIDCGADVNAFNKGLTPLYNAVFYKREESVKVLLAAGAWLKRGCKTELHLLAELGGSKILKLILQDVRCTPETVNIRDDEGRTALHVAAQYLHRNCLCMLIDKGGDLIATTNDGETVIDIMFETFTNPCKIFTDVLDSKIVMSCVGKYRCHYDIDFSALAPRGASGQMEVISNVLAAGSPDEKIEFLQHPVVELFLVLKWNKIRHFFYFWICVYAVFALSMSLTVVLSIKKYVDSVLFLDVLCYVVILTSAGLLGHAIIQCALIRRNFLGKCEIWMNLACTSLALATTTVTLKKGHEETEPWILQTTSFTILLVWLELMLLIGRLPSLGHYALMFAAVLQNVVKVLLAFIFLVIGFSFSFFIQFSGNEFFGSPLTSLVKTFVMLTGEYDYANLFSRTPRSVIPYTIFVLFVIFGSIVLMNLMIGLAVSDIQELRREGHARKLEKQAEFLGQLEEVLSSKQLNSSYTPRFVKRLLVKRSFIGTFYELKTSIEFQRSQKIPRNVVDRIAAVAKARMNSREN